ncbi:uncharacterized protein MELLADRAFT_79631 [Melampsora larici-populina 98AG31]|uniref:MHYT domain-containing protein n=1 Tax=Melampsora larici-populina (strain 98AG31 / pathotype 3-4-7) TaxID=747676 RepID=F4S9H5_MELLP|nr:uncharacterized protein MELLADRAFT_79631 [Melampsora larici-populina 98AG31]EGF98730.1 hypothetical protein MELLADRAFT_79631 [Melampsora larici-populina 98AG31]
MAFVFVGTGPEALPFEDEEEVSDHKRDLDVDLEIPLNNRKRSSPIIAFFKPIFSFINMRLLIGGILVGGTVALMHYSAGFHASFRREYTASKLASSIVLACFASTAALVVFFRFQSQWQHNWWKRLLCAILLSTGVCGMHYLGLSGTQWYVPADRVEGFSLGAKSSTVLTIAISIMCFGVCIISLMITLSDFLVTRESRRKARRVAIASVIFDKTGRVLVNLDGMLPMSEVESDLPLKDITQELNIRQPTFQWLYALSCDWSIIDPFIPRIVARSLGLEGKESKGWHGINFVGVPMSSMGVLFDTVLRTGTRVVPPSPDSKNGRLIRNDEESSMFSVAAPAQRQQGIMLFLVRELVNTEQDSTDSYLRRGFRFADPRWLSPILADRAGVPKIEIDGLLEHLKLYARRGMKPCVRSGGSYVGFFAVRPSISRQGGIDTLVYQFARHQIPAYRLPDVEVITEEMRAWIVSMSGRSMKEIGEFCLKEVNKDVHMPGRQAEDMWIFKSSLILAIDAMINNLSMFAKLSEKSFLSAEIVEVPSSDDDSTSTASMVIFHAAFPAPVRHGHELPGLAIPHEVSGTYQTLEPMPTFTFMPYSFFAKSQMMLLKGNNARKFAKECRSDLIKRYHVPVESLHPYLTSPQDRKTPCMDQMMTSLSRPEHALVQKEPNITVNDEYDDIHTDLMLRYEDMRAAPVPHEGKLGRRRASGMSAMTMDSNLSSLQQTLFDEISAKPIPQRTTDQIDIQFRNEFPDNALSESVRSPSDNNDFSPIGSTWRSPDSDGVAAPAYSPLRLPPALGSPLKAGGITKHSQLLRNSLLPPRRPHTADDGKVQKKAMIGNPTNRIVRPSTANAAASGSHSVGGEAILDPRAFLEHPRRVISNRSLSQSESSRYQRPFTSAQMVSLPSKRMAHPLAINARLRSDDWASRCLDGLEQSTSGQELLGVDW